MEAPRRRHSIRQDSCSFSEDEDDEVSSKEEPGESSSTTTDNNGPSSTSSGKDEPMAREETRAVNRSKLLVYAALVLAATAVGAFWYIFLTNGETEDFEIQAYEVSQKIIESAEANAKEALGSIYGLGNAITSQAMSTNASWPEVTLPHFDIRSTASFEQRAGAELIIFAPLVPRVQKASWEKYAVQHQGWIEEDLFYRGLQYAKPGNIPDEIYPLFTELDDHHNDFYVPIWQIGPVPTNASIVNLDLYSHPSFRRMIHDVLDVKHMVLSEVLDRDFLKESIGTLDQSMGDENPRSYVTQPVFDGFGSDASVVGFLFAVIPWNTYFIQSLPSGTKAIRVDVNDTCGDSFAYMVSGPDAQFLGRESASGMEFEHLKQTVEFAEFARWDGEEKEGSYIVHCTYSLALTPTSEFQGEYKSNDPLIFTIVVLLVFFFTAMVFSFYDCTVRRRQDIVMATAKRSQEIVSSLFPKSIQKRMMKEAEQKAKEAVKGNRKYFAFSAKARLGDVLSSGEFKPEITENTSGDSTNDKPLAELFPEVTIMFADIVGFTAWSSMREPSQVFTLLESIFHTFDDVAKKRRVFKVETVGDCYVAVAGLPTPRRDHAVVMGRFATECLYKMHQVLRDLEVRLGPDTSELDMRFGLHSGPVTAGVLRGERARFQLFGDTMNTCSRIESTGERGRIHVSQQCADYLSQARKEHWLRPREDKVTAKGKGELTTFWLEIKASSNTSPSVDHSCSEGSTSKMMDHTDLGHSGVEVTPSGLRLSEKLIRLVEWNVEVLSNHLKSIMARRKVTNAIDPQSLDSLQAIRTLEMVSTESQFGETPLDEAQDIVFLPKFDPRVVAHQVHPSEIELPQEVTDQLRAYLMTIATLYRDNAFHNFEHASHVTMSVTKLLSRIVAPDLDGKEAAGISSLHDHTYGITSDPLTQFAVVLSALIHDVDHRGVPNTQLIDEVPALGRAYNNKSVAEQNSVDVAWDLLMDDDFRDLRRAIYSTEHEFKHFRQLVVNIVLATDIMDKDLGAVRKARWNKAFSGEETTSVEEDTNRKATIVIEHLIQASDVAHTMQHWHIYRKWNQRFFEETYSAYSQGRTTTDPSLNWYKGEIGFFDFYIIPLAKKLKDCGVFGVSSDEYLTYAMQNRQEWEAKGEAIVAEMVEAFHAKHMDNVTRLTL